MTKAQDTDAVLWAFLVAELSVIAAEVRLPAPPVVPVFARLTVRPSKGAAS